jgi:hypothetical protein
MSVMLNQVAATNATAATLRAELKATADRQEILSAGLYALNTVVGTVKESQQLIQGSIAQLEDKVEAIDGRIDASVQRGTAPIMDVLQRMMARMDFNHASAASPLHAPLPQPLTQPQADGAPSSAAMDGGSLSGSNDTRPLGKKSCRLPTPPDERNEYTAMDTNEPRAG